MDFESCGIGNIMDHAMPNNDRTRSSVVVLPIR